MSDYSRPWENILKAARLVVESTGKTETPTYPHTVAHFRMGVAQTVLGREVANRSFARFSERSEQLLNEEIVGRHQRPRLLLMRSLVEWIAGTDPTPPNVYTIADETVQALSQGVNRSVVPALLFLLSRCYLEVKDLDRLLHLRQAYPDLWIGLPDTTEKRLIDQGVLDLQASGAIFTSWCTTARAMILQTLRSDDPELLPLDSMLHYMRIITHTASPAQSAAFVLQSLM